MRSFNAGPVPLYGTTVTVTSIAFKNKRPQRWEGADSGVSVHHLFPVRLHMRDEIIEVPSRKLLSGDENHRRFRDHPDRLEVLDRVVTEVAVECGIGRMAK